MNRCNMFGYMLKASWELPVQASLSYWLSQSNGFEFEKAIWNICSAWSEDHICQVWWRLDRICGFWKCTIDFDIFRNDSQILMWKIVWELSVEVWQYHQTLKNKFAIHLCEEITLEISYCSFTLGKSHICTPRFPWPRTSTNHISESDIGRPKASLFYRPDTARVSSIG